MTSPSALAPYAQYTLSEAVIRELPGYYRGKVRENYDLPDGTRILIATDRISHARPLPQPRHRISRSQCAGV
jgi:phosphoribosylaminoimidazole-succinocarboxamide synthase